jgi:hypothetical protein
MTDGHLLRGVRAGSQDKHTSSIKQADLMTSVGTTRNGHRVVMRTTVEQQAHEHWLRAIESARTSGIVERIRDARIIGTRFPDRPRTEIDEDGDEIVGMVLESVSSERDAIALAAAIQHDLDSIRPILNQQFGSMVAAYLTDWADHGVARHVIIGSFPRENQNPFEIYDDQMAVGLRVGYQLELFAYHDSGTLRGWSVVGLIGDWTSNYNRYLPSGQNILTIYESDRDAWVEAMEELRDESK